MSSIFPFLLIIFSLTVIIIIVVRKFPQLTLLDIDNLPEVKEGKKKKEFLKRRSVKRSEKAKNTRIEKIKPVVVKMKETQLKFRKYVGKVQKALIADQNNKILKAPKVIKERKKEELADILRDGTIVFSHGELELAERKFISAIKIDPKSSEAYRGLADVYFEQGQLEEAEETYRFVLQLNRNDDSSMVKFAELLEQRGKKEEAVDWYQKSVLINPNLASRFAKIASLLHSMEAYEPALEAISQAVELENKNPKYLDKLVEISIMSGNQSIAKEAFEQLRRVNSDNKKLRTLKDRIYKMSD